MKNLFLALFLLQFFVLDAQKMSYKEKQELFPTKGYKTQKGDKYDPTTATLLSFLIPGVGQMYAGQAGRGIGMLASSALFASLTSIGINENKRQATVCYDAFCGQQSGAGRTLIIFGSIAYLATAIYSMVDANQVAKVNSQYEKSKSKKAVENSPNLGFINNQGESIPTAGVVVRF